MVIHILISIVFYFILMYLSINLLGFFVRGFFSDPELARLAQEGQEFIKNEAQKVQKANKLTNAISAILLVAFLYSLLYFWNIGVVVVAIMIMAGRFPDLLWEIKNGKKITREIAKTLPHNTLFYITAFLPWGALPLLYYFLYLYK